MLQLLFAAAVSVGCAGAPTGPRLPGDPDPASVFWVDYPGVASWVQRRVGCDALKWEPPTRIVPCGPLPGPLPPPPPPSWLAVHETWESVLSLSWLCASCATVGCLCGVTQAPLPTSQTLPCGTWALPSDRWPPCSSSLSHPILCAWVLPLAFLILHLVAPRLGGHDGGGGMVPGCWGAGEGVVSRVMCPGWTTVCPSKESVVGLLMSSGRVLTWCSPCSC
jgi:hypothetical protein